MHTISERIRSWLAGRSYWEQLAFEALSSGSTLDEEELLEHLLHDHQLSRSDLARPPISERIELRTESEPPQLKLQSISSLENVNALVPDQKLTFCDGLTVVFGANGTGKSGYARALRALGSSRASSEILPNVALDPTAGARQQFVARAELNGVEKELVCEIGQAPLLPQVYIFDSEAATIHLTESSEITVTPAALRPLSDLASLTDRLRDKLQQQIESAASRRDFGIQMLGPSPVKDLVSAIDADTDVAVLQQLALLPETTTDEVKRLQAELFTLQGSDPSAEAETLRAAAADLASLSSSLTGVADALCEAVAADLAQTRKATTDFEELASNNALRVSEGVDAAIARTSEWRAFINAAHVAGHVTAGAYPAEGDRCLLCNQALSGEAVARIQRLWKFVDSTAAQQLSLARQTLSAARSRIEAAGTSFWKETTAAYRTVARYDSTLLPLVTDMCLQLDARRSDLLSDVDNEKLAALPERAVIERVTQLQTQLLTRRRLLLDDKERTARAADIEAQLRSIQHRQQLAEIIELIRAHVSQARWALQSKSPSTRTSSSPAVQTRTPPLPPSGFFYGTGVAPSAGVFLTRIDPDAMSADQYPNQQMDTLVTDAARDAITHSVYVQNYSVNRYQRSGTAYGCSRNSSQPCGTELYDGLYSSMSRDVDRAVRDADPVAAGDQPITIVVSAGNHHQQDGICESAGLCTQWNARWTLPPATAKSAISVGAAENPRDASQAWNCYNGATSDVNNIAEDSKRGTYDPGWFKPDLFAPAAVVTSLLSPAKTSAAVCTDGNPLAPNYVTTAGTSLAAPVVTGAALLASRRYAELVRGQGAPSPSIAKPALIKAMLIGSAASMRSGQDKPGGGAVIGALPNNKQGFGRVQISTLFDDFPAKTFVNETQPLSSSVTQWQRSFAIQDPTLPVVIVLAWSDEPGAEMLPHSNSRQLPTNTNDPSDPDPTKRAIIINDLDLTASFGAGAWKYRGNITSVRDTARGEESQKLASGDASSDTKNTVEVIRFFPASDGVTSFTLTVSRVRGSSAAQPFAPYASNAFDTNSPPPSPPVVTATGVSSTAVTVTWPAVAGAASYDVQRRGSGGTWSATQNVTGNTYADSGLSPDSAYVYRVRAKNASGLSTWSADTATTVVFDSADTAVGGVVRAAHVNQLRTAAGALALLAGFSPPAFTDPTLSAGTSIVKGIHVTELRSALTQSLGSILGTAPTFAEAIEPGVTMIKAGHFDELRTLAR